jgi:hypothetical protein
MTTEISAENIPLQNIRYELFAQNRAIGLPALDACAAAGFERSSSLANRMEERPEIVARIIQLRAIQKRSLDERRKEMDQEAAASELGVTPRWVIERLKENVTLAQDANQFGAANSSLKLVSELIGMKNASSPDDQKSKTASLPVDQLAEMTKRLSQLPPIPEGDFQIDQLDALDDEAIKETDEDIDDA